MKNTFIIIKIYVIFYVNLNITTEAIETKQIIGGRDCEPDNQQIAVAVTSFFGMPICSGSLLHPKWVLTAAHCKLPCTSYYASLAHTRDKYIDWDGWLTWDCPVTKVDHIYIHPQYNEKFVVHDIALMKLVQPIQTDITGVNVISLPLPQSDKQVYPMAPCTVATAIGFGVISKYDMKQTAVKVQCLYIGVLTDEECQRRLPKNLLVGYRYKICVDATPSTDVCFGDSGGPLMCGDTQIGIASYIGSKQCASGNPAIFTRLERYLDYINRTINRGSQIILSKYLTFIASIFYAINL